MPRRPLAHVAVAVVLLSACKGKEPPPAASAEPKAAAPPKASAPPPDPPGKVAHDAVVKAPTREGAVKIAKPFMKDSRNDTSLGTVLLASWAMKMATWDDFAVTKDETTFARIRKDSDEERAKRLCIGSTIIQIEKAPLDGGRVFAGLLMDGGSNIFHFLAVGSTGTLVQRSHARFCGVVTNLYDYENSGGGVGHAVEMVGMFDLPENRKK